MRSRLFSLETASQCSNIGSFVATVVFGVAMLILAVIGLRHQQVIVVQDRPATATLTAHVIPPTPQPEPWSVRLLPWMAIALSVVVIGFGVREGIAYYKVKRKRAAEDEQLRLECEARIRCEEEKAAALHQVQRLKAPRIYPRLLAPGEVPGHQMQTRLVLENRGDTDAHDVVVAQLHFDIGEVVFTGPIGVIAPQNKVEVISQCDAFGPMFSQSLIAALKKQFEKQCSTWDALMENPTISVPLQVAYTDFLGNPHETACDLIFNGVVESLKPDLAKDKPSVEFRNFKFT